MSFHFISHTCILAQFFSRLCLRFVSISKEFNYFYLLITNNENDLHQSHVAYLLRKWTFFSHTKFICLDDLNFIVTFFLINTFWSLELAPFSYDRNNWHENHPKYVLLIFVSLKLVYNCKHLEIVSSFQIECKKKHKTSSSNCTKISQNRNIEWSGALEYKHQQVGTFIYKFVNGQFLNLT